MSNTNGIQTFSQSMNGLTDIIADDIITDTLTANTLYTQVIRAPIPSSVSDVYGTSTSTIYFAGSASLINFGALCPTINIGTFTNSAINLGNASSIITCQNLNCKSATTSASLFQNLTSSASLTIGSSGRTTGITNFYGGGTFNLNLYSTSDLNLGSATRTAGQTNLYAGDNFNLYSNSDINFTTGSNFNLIPTASSGHSSFKTTLGTDEVYQRYYTNASIPTTPTCEVYVDIGGTYRVSTPYYQFFFGNNQYVTDLSNGVPDTIRLRYGCSSANPGVESAQIIIQNGTATNYEGDVSIESKTFNLLTQTDINIGTSATTNNNIGSLTILNNKISATGTNIALGDPLSSGYSYPITAGFLGSVYTGSAFTTGTITPTGTFYTLSTLASVPIGNYMVTACVPFSSSGTGLLLTKINITITSEVTTPIPITLTHLNVNIPYTGAIPIASHSYPASTIMQLTAISTVNLNLSLSFTSGTYTRITTNGLFKLMRIA